MSCGMEFSISFPLIWYFSNSIYPWSFFIILKMPWKTLFLTALFFRFDFAVSYLLKSVFLKSTCHSTDCCICCLRSNTCWNRCLAIYLRFLFQQSIRFSSELSICQIKSESDKDLIFIITLPSGQSAGKQIKSSLLCGKHFIW